MGDGSSKEPTGWTSEQQATALERLTIGRERVKRGWCRGRYHRETAEGQILSYCSLGAILDETGLFDQTTRRAGLLLIDAVDDIYGKFVYDDLVEFNDDIKRRKEEVIRVFNKAIQSIK